MKDLNNDELKDVNNDELKGVNNDELFLTSFTMVLKVNDKILFLIKL
jgi:hypothetical protein